MIKGMRAVKKLPQGGPPGRFLLFVSRFQTRFS